MRTARNILIIAVIAGAIVALPGGGTAADVVYALLSVIFAGALGFAFVRLYLERRIDIYSLEDRERTLLYGAFVVIALTLAAFTRLTATAGGTIAMVALFAFSAWALMYVYRAWRQY